MMNDYITITDERFSINYHVPDVELAHDAKHEWELPMMDEIALTVNVPDEFMEWIKRTREELGFDQRPLERTTKMIDTLSRGTYTAELAIILSLIAIVGVGYCIWAVRKMAYANIAAFYQMQNTIKHAIMKLQEEQCKDKE